MKGTWRGLPPGDPGGYLEKSLDGHLYIGAPVLGNLEGLSIRDSESRKGSGDSHLFL